MGHHVSVGANTLVRSSPACMRTPFLLLLVFHQAQNIVAALPRVPLYLDLLTKNRSLAHRTAGDIQGVRGLVESGEIDVNEKGAQDRTALHR